MRLGLCLATLSMTLSGCGDAKGTEHQASSASENRHDPTVKEQKGSPIEEESTTHVVLTDAAERTAGIIVEPLTPASPQSVQASLIVPGTVEPDPRRVAVISSRVAGRLEHTMVVEGDRVTAGQTIGYIYSTTYITAQSDYQQSIARANALQGTSDAQGANAIVEAARRRLVQLGVSSSEIARLAAQGEPHDALSIVAPFAGSITHANVLPGAAVDVGTPIFQIADLSIVDVIANIPERAVGAVRIGQPATVTIAAFPTRRFTGHVERLRDMLDSTTRTVGAIVHVMNPSHALRPQMYATVALGVPNNTTAGADTRVEPTHESLLIAPETAVVTDGSQSYVFVETAPHTFERRTVTATALAPTSGNITGGRVALTGEIRAGDRVVTHGAFTLKSELAKSALADED